jgi:hypothetical protein
MRPPTAHIIELAHGAMSTHILGALARLDLADHLAAGPRGLADLAAVTGTEPELLDRLLRAATVLGLVERNLHRISHDHRGWCLAALTLWRSDPVGARRPAWVIRRRALYRYFSSRDDLLTEPCAPCSSGAGCTAL